MASSPPKNRDEDYDKTRSSLSQADQEMIMGQKRKHLKMMKQLQEEFSGIAAHAGTKKGRVALTPQQLHRLQRERREDSMKVKNMRGLLARLEVTLHHKEKQNIMNMIASVANGMNNFGEEEKTLSSMQIKDLIHSHVVQKEHLEHEMLDLKIEESKLHSKEMQELKILQGT